jgi:FMN hydrolase / 5-amino-6-(5-phospho-D-ribitylamino)uracil phosphatase
MHGAALHTNVCDGRGFGPGRSGAVGSTRAVLVDFGGTLDADGVRWAVRFHAAYRRSGGALSLRRFEPIFRASDRALERSPRIRDMGFRAMIDAQAALLRDLLPDGGAVNATQMADRFHAEAVRAVERNRPALAAVRARSRMGMVSNFTGNLERCLDELGIRSCFDIVTDSAVHGISKPDPTLFTRTLDALGVPASAACMVGDNLTADIRVAHALAMRTVWIARPRRRTPPDVAPTVRLARFADVPDALVRMEAACTA